MKEEIEKLELLQKVDIEILDIAQEKSDIEKNIISLEEKLKEKQSQIDSKENDIKELETKRLDLEKMLFLEQDKLKKTRAKLQGSGVKSPHAFNANQREIEKLKKEVEELEDELLKIMTELESRKSALERYKLDLAEIKQVLADSETEAKDKSALLNTRMAELEVNRKEIEKGIDPRILATYRRIQARYQRNPIAIAWGESCLGCHMNIPPQLYNELQKCEKLITCPACHRILVFKGHPENNAGALQ